MNYQQAWNLLQNSIRQDKAQHEAARDRLQNDATLTQEVKRTLISEHNAAINALEVILNRMEVFKPDSGS